MIRIPVIRWGKPYTSLDVQTIHHFHDGTPIAEIDQAGGAMVTRDLRQAGNARAALRQFSPKELMAMIQKAGEYFENETLEFCGYSESPEDFVYRQSATSGLPQHMCRANMAKNAFVMNNIGEILEALSRGLDLEIIRQGYGMEDRGVMVSYQSQSPVLGAVLPSNSPGVHTLWIPVVALYTGLFLKPGSQEPWTAYRVAAAFAKAGIPKEAISLFPGGHDVGGSILSRCNRAMIFGGKQTIDQYAGNPRVQVHGPGYSKILLGDDVVDRWPEYIDMICESIFINGGRSCINASSVWASRHTEEIAEAISERLGPIQPKPPADPESSLAAFTVEGAGKAIHGVLQNDLKEEGVTDYTGRFGERLVEEERCSYLRPVIAHADSPDREIVKKEYMFPFATVVKCPQDQMLSKIGYTLVGTAITEDAQWQSELADSIEIDRLNIGPIGTHKLNWLQPHEGNLIEFLFRSRAYQVATEQAKVGS